MNMSTLNLTRKWRSKSFDQVIGQELTIRMLKNSLYRNQFFPVYLFSGQRGCGKTSTARIFAAAVNCQALHQFQENPKSTAIPCLVCASCLAMNNGNHPDFFEIDAASHTGVDTVRQLIDAAQLLPVMGSKKIYLIDEAHMLSKASFNALLKILEEPPHSVVFILATTDVHKIIDTVRSRCFQLFFSAVSQDHLYQHLVYVCDKENIIVDDQALHLISGHAQGSLRDALNLLEQVRFASAKVTKHAVQTVLGYLDDEQVVTLFEKIATAKPADVLAYIQEIHLDSYCPERVWERLIAYVRAALWIKHSVSPQQFIQYEARIKRLVAQYPWPSLLQLCERLHTEYAIAQKTTIKYSLLEMILLQTCYNTTTSGTTNGAAGAAGAVGAPDFIAQHSDTDEQDEEHDHEVTNAQLAELWTRFLRDCERLADPLLLSLLQQGQCVGYKNFQVQVEFSKQFVFFQDCLTATRSAWSPLVRAIFGPKATLQVSFTMPDLSKQVQQPPLPADKQIRSPELIKHYPVHTKTSLVGKKEIIVDITKDIQAWPLTHMLISQFPGTITEIGETFHG